MPQLKNKKHETFAQEYIIDMNCTQAAIRAGYSERSAGVTGHRLLKDAKISKRVEELRESRSKRTEIDQDYVINGIVDVLERCRQVRPVVGRDGRPIMVETPEGETTAAYTFEANPALKGLELLGKHMGLFVDRLKVEDEPTPVKVEINVIDASKKEDD